MSDKTIEKLLAAIIALPAGLAIQVMKMQNQTKKKLIKASNALDAGFIILQGFESTKKSLDIRHIKARKNYKS